MVYFIIILVILVFVLEWLFHFLNIFTAGVKANIFTLFAIVTGLISAFFFWISGKSFKDYKSKEVLMKIVNKNLPTKNNSPTEIDLSQVNLQGLVKELNHILTSPTPLIFKGWGNKRLEMDVKRAELINKYIQNVIATGQSFIQLRVDSIVSYEKIQLLSETELNRLRKTAKESKFSLNLLEDRYEYELTAIKTDTELLKLGLERVKMDLKHQRERHEMELKERESLIHERDRMSDERLAIIQMQNNKTEAEIYCMKLQAKSDYKIKDKVSVLFNKIIEDLKMDSLTPSQVLVLITLFGNASPTTIEDFEAKKQLLSEEIERMKQENEYKRAEAKEKHYDAEFKHYKLEKEKLGYGT